MYTHELTASLKCNVKPFADDTSLFTVVKDLNLIYQWVMSFIPAPQKQAVELLFSRRRHEIDHPDVLFNNVPVKK